jgi:hypothetical protein
MSKTAAEDLMQRLFQRSCRISVIINSFAVLTNIGTIDLLLLKNVIIRFIIRVKIILLDKNT